MPLRDVEVTSRDLSKVTAHLQGEKVKVTLEQAMKVQTGSSGMALLLL
jgi:hypothetical protein